MAGNTKSSSWGTKSSGKPRVLRELADSSGNFKKTHSESGEKSVCVRVLEVMVISLTHVKNCVCSLGFENGYGTFVGEYCCYSSTWFDVSKTFAKAGSTTITTYSGKWVTPECNKHESISGIFRTKDFGLPFLVHLETQMITMAHEKIKDPAPALYRNGLFSMKFPESAFDDSLNISELQEWGRKCYLELIRFSRNMLHSEKTMDVTITTV